MLGVVLKVRGDIFDNEWRKLEICSGEDRNTLGRGSIQECIIPSNYYTDQYKLVI